MSTSSPKSDAVESLLSSLEQTDEYLNPKKRAAGEPQDQGQGQDYEEKTEELETKIRDRVSPPPTLLHYYIPTLPR